jgi:hypothetical protein
MALPDVKTMGTYELDALLQAVSLERAKREPAVTLEQPRTMEAAIDPKWYVSLAGTNTFLQLRHPGYGWVGYLIPAASRAELASYLLQHALLPAPKPDAPPPAASSGGGTVH